MTKTKHPTEIPDYVDTHPSWDALFFWPAKVKIQHDYGQYDRDKDQNEVDVEIETF